MFNCAKGWTDIEKKKRKGQRDLYEGVFAACNLLDINSVLSYHRMYDDVETKNDTYFQDFAGEITMEQIM